MNKIMRLNFLAPISCTGTRLAFIEVISSNCSNNKKVERMASTQNKRWVSGSGFPRNSSLWRRLSVSEVVIVTDCELKSAAKFNVHQLIKGLISDTRLKGEMKIKVKGS